jgi:hypothetical protein
MKKRTPKLNDVKIEIVRVTEQCVRVWYIKGMDLRLTTKGFTGKVDLRTYQCAWSLVTLIGYGNLSGLDIHINL